MNRENPAAERQHLRLHRPPSLLQLVTGEEIQDVDDDAVIPLKVTPPYHLPVGLTLPVNEPQEIRRLSRKMPHRETRRRHLGETLKNLDPVLRPGSPGHCTDKLTLKQKTRPWIDQVQNLVSDISRNTHKLFESPSIEALIGLSGNWVSP